MSETPTGELKQAEHQIATPFYRLYRGLSKPLYSFDHSQLERYIAAWMTRDGGGRQYTLRWFDE